jgi:hypothetical protein
LLPLVAACDKKAVAFLHVDCDLYSATKTVLEQVAPPLVEGTVIVFDEYFNYPGWQHREFKACAEFGYDYIGYIRNGGQVAVRLERRDAAGVNTRATR